MQILINYKMGGHIPELFIIIETHLIDRRRAGTAKGSIYQVFHIKGC